MEVNRDVTFYADTTLGKAKNLSIPRKDDDEAAEKQDGPLTDEPMPGIEGPNRSY